MSTAPGNPLDRMTMGTRLAAGGALVLLIAVFLPWVTASVSGPLAVGGAGGSLSGWSAYGLGKLAALAALVILGVIAVELYSPKTSLPFPPSLIVLGAAAIAVLCVLYHLLFLGYSVNVPKEAAAVIKLDVSRGWGMFVALIAAGVAAYGGFRRLSE